LSSGPSGSKYSLVSQNSNPSLVDTSVLAMQYSDDTTPFLGSDVSLDHVFLHLFQPMVEEVVMSMKSLVNPILLLDSDKYKEVTF
jgi:hypothetical protein